MALKYKMDFFEVSSLKENNLNEKLTSFAKEVTKIKIEHIPLKEVYMSFLLSIDDNFDDDLLMDAIECLVGL